MAVDNLPSIATLLALGRPNFPLVVWCVCVFNRDNFFHINGLGADDKALVSLLSLVFVRSLHWGFPILHLLIWVLQVEKSYCEKIVQPVVVKTGLICCKCQQISGNASNFLYRFVFVLVSGVY